MMMVLSYSAVIYLSTGIMDVRNRCVLEELQGSELGRRTIFSSTGRRPASLCHGLLSVVRPSVP